MVTRTQHRACSSARTTTVSEMSESGRGVCCAPGCVLSTLQILTYRNHVADL